VHLTLISQVFSWMTPEILTRAAFKLWREIAQRRVRYCCVYHCR
jgi:hypothetical protein